MKDPLVVSIVIITRNRPFLLRHCIERVLDQPYPHKEIIVVDSSSNYECERVVAQYPEVISVRLRGQRNNMPQARNKGIEVSSGNIVAFIDDDSMVYPSWLEALLNTYSDETVGAVGGRVISMPEPYSNEIYGPPYLIVSPSGRVKGKGVGLVSIDQVDVDHLVGCNMSFRRKALEQVGGFDANYTLTNLREETDLCVRVKKAGWRIVFSPEMAVLHFSARAQTPFVLGRPYFQFSHGRNSMYFAIKHFGCNPRTLIGQLIVDAGVDASKLLYIAGLLSIGVVAQVIGRVVGLGAGIALLTSRQGCTVHELRNEVGKPGSRAILYGSKIGFGWVSRKSPRKREMGSGKKRSVQNRRKWAEKKP